MDSGRLDTDCCHLGRIFAGKGKRIMRALGLVIALTAALILTVEAQAAPDAAQCVDAYVVAHAFRADVRTLEAQPNAVPFHGLAAYADGFDTIDFDHRARDVDKREPDPKLTSGRVLDAALGSSAKVDVLVGESAAAHLAALTSTADSVYREQRALLARVSACDVAYEFKPVLGGVPSNERVVALLKGATERSVQAKNERLAALDDKQCAIRFELAANLFAAGSAGRTVMHERAGAAGNQALAALGDMPRERFAQTLQRELLERADKYKSGAYTPRELIEEVNACERRYGLAVTDLHSN